MKTNFAKDEPRVSPDGRWMAYNTLESGRWEVYLASFPGFTGRRQVSNNGGVQGYWRRNGKELFYLTLDGDPMSVLIKPGNPPEPAAPKPLFHSRVPVSAVADQFAATADGQRFIFLESPQDASSFFTILVGLAGGGQQIARRRNFWAAPAPRAHVPTGGSAGGSFGGSPGSADYRPDGGMIETL